MANWTVLDFLIFLIFAFNAVRGMSRGASREILSMINLSAALIIMIRFTITLTDFFNSSPLLKTVVNTTIIQNFMQAIDAGPLTENLLKEIFYSLSLLVCFFGTFFALEAGLNRPGFVETFSFPYAAINRHVGFVLGFVRGYVFTLLLLLILAFHLLAGNNLSGINKSMIQNSYFAHLFLGATARLDQIIIDRNPDTYREIFKDKYLYSPEMLKQQLESGVEVPKNTGLP